jgi:hypothetical protein
MSSSKTPPPKKKTPAGGRVTPKGTASGNPATRRPRPEAADGHPGASSRYTPPVPLSDKITAPWVVPVMFALLGIGVLVIVLNYMGLLPGGTDNWYLIGGLGLILGGIVTATQLH